MHPPTPHLSHLESSTPPEGNLLSGVPREALQNHLIGVPCNVLLVKSTIADRHKCLSDSRQEVILAHANQEKVHSDLICARFFAVNCRARWHPGVHFDGGLLSHGTNRSEFCPRELYGANQEQVRLFAYRLL